MAARRLAVRLALFGLIAFHLSSAGRAAEPSPAGEWRHYGGDLASTKYSPLDQISHQNASQLKMVWQWDSPDAPLQKAQRGLGSFAYEATPLMVGGTLYVSTSLSQVAAIDPKTGQTRWVFNPEVYKAGRPTNLGYVHRGVAYWTDGGQERIYLAAHDAYLYAIDAKTGKTISEFGEEGRVNLAKAIPRAVNAQLHHDQPAGDLPQRGGRGLFDQ